jgi:hypothetical protein
VSYKLWQLFVLAGVPALAAAAVLVAHARPDAAPPTRDAIVERTPNDYDQLADADEAQGNVRAAVPALEAYRADTGTYRGATVERLRAKYDAGIRGITLVGPGTTTYCLESTVGSATFHKNGRGAAIVKGDCP